MHANFKEANVRSALGADVHVRDAVDVTTIPCGNLAAT